tara:strand:- start:199 stop:336 length:138 start_codon:yes stop_codon:yes gene_type:complete
MNEEFIKNINKFLLNKKYKEALIEIKKFNDKENPIVFILFSFNKI